MLPSSTLWRLEPLGWRHGCDRALSVLTKYPLCSRKKEAREPHKRSQFAKKVHGLRAKLYSKKRYKEKATMKKT